MVRVREFVLGVTAVAALTGLGACSNDAPPPPPAAAPPASSGVPMQSRTAAGFEVAPDLPPVPGNIATAVRPPEVVKAAYLFAATRPDVLKYMPCFCGCERGGHRGNDDCFVTKRDAAGKPTQWEPHGMVCEVCIDVATQARQMHNSGASLTQIREAIEKHYAGARSHTPTPIPPPTKKTGAS